MSELDDKIVSSEVATQPKLLLEGNDSQGNDASAPTDPKQLRKAKYSE